METQTNQMLQLFEADKQTNEDTKVTPTATILVGPRTIESTVYKSNIGPIDLSPFPLAYRPTCLYSGEPQNSYESMNWFHVIGRFPSALPHGLENIPYEDGAAMNWEVKKYDIWEGTKGSKSFWVTLVMLEWVEEHDDSDGEKDADEDKDTNKDGDGDGDGEGEGESQVIVYISRAYVGLEDKSMKTRYSFTKGYMVGAKGGKYRILGINTDETKSDKARAKEWVSIPGYTVEDIERDAFDVFEVGVFMCELARKNASLSSVPLVPANPNGEIPNPFATPRKLEREPIVLDEGVIDMFDDPGRTDPYDIGNLVGRPLSPRMDWEIGHPDPIPPPPQGPIAGPPQDLIPGRGCPPLAPGYKGPFPGDGTLPPVPPTEHYIAPYISPELRLKVIQYQKAHGMKLDISDNYYFGRRCRPEHPTYDDDRDPRFTTGNEVHGPVEPPERTELRYMELKPWWGDESTDDELSDDEFTDDELTDDELADDELADDELTDNELDDELTDDEI